MVYDVSLVTLEPSPAAVVRGEVSQTDLPAFLEQAFAELASTLGEQGLTPTGPPFSRCVPHDGRFELATGFPVGRAASPAGRVVPDELPGGTAARTMHRGRYDAVGAAYEAVESWLTEHDLVASGAPWETYLDGPDVPEPRTQVFVPCRPAR